MNKYNHLTSEELVRVLDNTPDVSELVRLLVDRLDAALEELRTVRIQHGADA